MIVFEIFKAHWSFFIIGEDSCRYAALFQQRSDVPVVTMIVCEYTVGRREVVDIHIDTLFSYGNLVYITGDKNRLVIEIIHIALHFFDSFERRIDYYKCSIVVEFLTIGVFFGDPNAPVKRNVDEVYKALKMTEKLRTESASGGTVSIIADTMKCRIYM